MWMPTFNDSKLAENNFMSCCDLLLIYPGNEYCQTRLIAAYDELIRLGILGDAELESDHEAEKNYCRTAGYPA